MAKNNSKAKASDKAKAVSEKAVAATEQPVVQSAQHKDFVSRYSSNVQFDTSIWGLRMVFGELIGGATNRQVIEQHTAISMSWIHVKVFQAFLEAFLAWHEAGEQGDVEVPARLFPNAYDPSPDIFKNPAWAHKYNRLKERIDDIRQRLAAKTEDS